MERQELDQELYLVTSSPHVRTERNTQRIMLDVIVAMIPALLGAIYFFGFDALVLILISVISCVCMEALTQKLMKKPITVSDYSAVITGILLAFNLPASAPWWIPIFGSFIAIFVVKQLFGGLGCNFINPALTARATIMSSWPAIMASFPTPIRGVLGVDAVSGATPLGLIKAGGGDVISKLPELSDMLVGGIGGCLGETSAVLLLLGGVYLVVRRVIDWQTPVVYILTTAVLLWLLGVDPSLLSYHILGGGLILGAVFMATDYTTTPVSLRGRVVFAIGAGILTAVIRVKGSMSEGVSYSILFMNILTPLIERFTAPKIFGKPDTNLFGRAKK